MDYNKLPKEVKIHAPLINGEAWLRDLPPLRGIRGPYSSWYGGPLYAIVPRAGLIAAHKRARGANRRFIEEIIAHNA